MVNKKCSKLLCSYMRNSVRGGGDSLEADGFLRARPFLLRSAVRL